MFEYLQPVIAGAAIIGFWTWARSKISKVDRDTAVLKAWALTIDARCKERREDMQGLYQKFDEVKDAIASNDSQTAKALGRLEGKVDSLCRT